LVRLATAESAIVVVGIVVVDVVVGGGDGSGGGDVDCVGGQNVVVGVEPRQTFE